MPRRHAPGTRDEQLRQRIAQEAARLMAEEGVLDFATAKRKAVARLGAAVPRNLPGNQEIEQELKVYQRLFRAGRQPQRLRQLREAALEAMRLLARFHPRLVGPVLAGTADEHSPVHLHLFADTPEQLVLFLMEQRIPCQWDERPVRVSGERQERYPLCRFIAGDVPFELTLFPEIGLRQAPLSPVDGRPTRRGSVEQVEALLGEAPEKVD